MPKIAIITYPLSVILSYTILLPLTFLTSKIVLPLVMKNGLHPVNVPLIIEYSNDK